MDLPLPNKLHVLKLYKSGKILGQLPIGKKHQPKSVLTGTIDSLKHLNKTNSEFRKVTSLIAFREPVPRNIKILVSSIQNILCEFCL
jgi:hypothetical protein